MPVKQRSTTQEKIETTRTIIGIMLIVVSIVLFLAVIGFKKIFFLNQIKYFLYGLSGAFSFPIPFLVLWLGVIFVSNKKFNAYTRAFWFVVILYLEFLAIINIASTVVDVQDKTTYKLMDYILLYNKRVVMLPGVESFNMFASSLYKFSSTSPFLGQGGGAFGVFFAWPAWKYVGSVWGLVIISIITLLTLMLFFKLEIYNKIKKNHIIIDNNFQQPIKKSWFFSRNKKPEMNNFHKSNYYPNLGPYNYNIPYNYPNQNIPINNYQQPYFNQTDVLNNPFNNNIPTNVNYFDVPNQNFGNYPNNQNLNTNTPNIAYEIQDNNIAELKPLKKANKKIKDNSTLNKKKKVNAEQLINENEVVSESNNIQNKNIKNNIQELENQTSFFEPQTTMMPMDNIFNGQPSGRSFDDLEIKEPIFSKNNQKKDITIKNKPYKYPNAGLLKLPSNKKVDTSEQDILRAQLLEETLDSFGISAKVANVTHGPAVTRFELDLASGINVKRINNVADNIALNMSAENGIRIEAPIPGTTFVGIEIPNKTITTVTFREVLFSEEMKKEEDPLSIALGKDITGKPIICNLAQMPHLLIAGATGSGKSVCINSIINSIVFRCSPEDCRLILIDPKMVELQRYNVLPHLLIPVVTEPHKASGALSWALAEMTDRYNKFKDNHVDKITTYNNNLPEGAEKLPRIVVVIDELADLMISSSRKEIEHDINRIAALARAAGIHLVVATQRPSVDVITGVIKANLLSRIAFLTSSGTDSRTIIDRYGAENLVGNGDMLYMPSGYKNPLRVQGCFLQNDEINNIIAFIKKNNRTFFDQSAMDVIEESEASSEDLKNDDNNIKVDPLLEDAIDMVLSDGQASISMLQRRMSIGYARAGRIIDAMTKMGIISKADGSKPREVLISRSEYENSKL